MDQFFARVIVCLSLIGGMFASAEKKIDPAVYASVNGQVNLTCFTSEGQVNWKYYTKDHASHGLIAVDDMVQLPGYNAIIEDYTEHKKIYYLTINPVTEQQHEHQFCCTSASLETCTTLYVKTDDLDKRCKEGQMTISHESQILRLEERVTFSCPVSPDQIIHWKYQKTIDTKLALLARGDRVLVEQETYSVGESDANQLVISQATRDMNKTTYFCFYENVCQKALLHIMDIKPSFVDRGHLKDVSPKKPADISCIIGYGSVRWTSPNIGGSGSVVLATNNIATDVKKYEVDMINLTSIRRRYELHLTHVKEDMNGTTICCCSSIDTVCENITVLPQDENSNAVIVAVSVTVVALIIVIALMVVAYKKKIRKKNKHGAARPEEMEYLNGDADTATTNLSGPEQQLGSQLDDDTKTRKVRLKSKNGFTHDDYHVKVNGGKHMVHSSGDSYVYLKHGQTFGFLVENLNQYSCIFRLNMDGYIQGTWDIEAGGCLDVNSSRSSRHVFTFYRAKLKKDVSVDKDKTGLVECIFSVEKAVHPTRFTMDAPMKSGVDKLATFALIMPVSCTDLFKEVVNNIGSLNSKFTAATLKESVLLLWEKGGIDCKMTGIICERDSSALSLLCQDTKDQHLSIVPQRIPKVVISSETEPTRINLFNVSMMSEIDTRLQKNTKNWKLNISESYIFLSKTGRLLGQMKELKEDTHLIWWCLTEREIYEAGQQGCLSLTVSSTNKMATIEADDSASGNSDNELPDIDLLRAGVTSSHPQKVEQPLMTIDESRSVKLFFRLVCKEGDDPVINNTATRMPKPVPE